jgi:serine phosphatase RsbU (regulator of sigma subunit)
MSRAARLRGHRAESATANRRQLPRYVSIRWLLTAVLTVILIVLMTAAAGLMERDTQRLLNEQVEARLRLEAEQLAASSADGLLSAYPELALQPAIRRLVDDDRDIAIMTVVDGSGIIRADVDFARVGQRFEPLARLEAHVRNGRGASRTDVPRSSALLSNDTFIVARAPIVLDHARELGVAYVGVRRASVEEKIARARRSQIGVLAALLLLGAGVAYVVLWRSLRPISVLRAGIERFGRGELDTPVSLRDHTEFGLLADALNTMSWEILAAQGQLVQSERMSHELELARRIQESLIASGGTPPKGFVIEGRHRAATEVGGDYFEIFRLRDGRVGAVIADVAGKGLAGCLITVMVSALLRSQRDAHATPESLLDALDRSLVDLLPAGTFVTMFYGILDPASGTLAYASAGHHPALLFRRATQEIEALTSVDPPLAISRRTSRSFRGRSTRLEVGDILLQTTDGVHEAFGPDGAQQFGFERVEHILRDSAGAGVGTVIDALQKGLDAWRAGAAISDDETLLLLAREERIESGTTATTTEEGPVENLESAEGLLEHARRTGCVLELPAQLDIHEAIRSWLRDETVLPGLSDAQLRMLTLLIYEITSNVAEHGYRLDPDARFELWWAPGEVPAPPASRYSVVAATAALAGGRFIVVDHAVPFQPPPRTRSNYHDPEVRRSGRGHGLDIMGRLAEVEFHPSTPAGNVTVIRVASSGPFEPKQEVCA